MFRPEGKAKEEKEIKNLPMVSKGDVLTFKKVEIKERPVHRNILRM